MAAGRNNKLKTAAIVPGSYDPVTRGHLYLIRYAAAKYEKVYAAIFVNKDKTCFFSPGERLALLRAACARFRNVEVVYDEGMLWKFAQTHGVTVSVRGWRDDRDRAYEERMAAANKTFLNSLDTELIACPDAAPTPSPFSEGLRNSWT